MTGVILGFCGSVQDKRFYPLRTDTAADQHRAALIGETIFQIDQKGDCLGVDPFQLSRAVAEFSTPAAAGPIGRPFQNEPVAVFKYQGGGRAAAQISVRPSIKASTLVPRTLWL